MKVALKFCVSTCELGRRNTGGRPILVVAFVVEISYKAVHESMSPVPTPIM